jgi:aldehyde dehydrogenase (NAD+)
MTQRAEYLRAIAAGLRKRADDVGQIWPREAGVLHGIAQGAAKGAAHTFEYYASLADTFAWEQHATPTAGGEFGLIVREPVGVVGAIVPWNGPLSLITYKVAPALIAGCTVVLKSSPEAPSEG